MTPRKAKAESAAALRKALSKLAPDDRAIILEALAEAERKEIELRYLADHDSLTGLLDRRRFRAELDRYLAFGARYGGQGAVMIVDIDDLKSVNDTYGHHAGDTLIRRCAEILRRRVRTTDSVARLSGDEFAVLMPQTDVAGALQLGEDLRQEIAEHAAPPDAEPASVSIGVAMFGAKEPLGSDAVMVAADQAMYQAKKQGRDRIALHDEKVADRQADGKQPRERRGQTTASRIRDALTGDRLSLHTQPIRDISSGAIERYELLLRMIDESGELVPAASFIAAAERAGLVQELDRWVVSRALELAGERERAGQPVRLHVNISGASVADVSVTEFIERRLDEGDADPSRCTFEITESAGVHDYEAAVGFADRIGEFGCQVAIDDYGSGISPFHYLRRIPFDLIKIDGDFIRDMARSDADQLTVRAIVDVAQGLGKQTIAEFVQDEATMELLREYGVDMAQGFHLGRPVDANEALSLS